MTILLPSLAVLIPILTLPFWFFYFDITPKIVALLIGTAAACAFVPWRIDAIAVFLKSTAGRRLGILIGLQLVALIVSTALSGNRFLSIGGSNWRMYGLITQFALLILMFLMAVEFSQKPGLVLTVRRAVALSGLFIALYAVLQYAGWDPLLPSATYHIGEGEWTIVRPPGTIGHADYLGPYLVFVVFLGGSLAWTEADRLWRVIGVATLALGSFGIVLSGTRSAMLALVAGAALLLVGRRPDWKKVAGGAVLCVVLLAGFYYSPPGLKLRGRARWFREDPTGGARVLLWRDSLQMAASRPLTGFGPEMFSSEFPQFQSLELARAYPDFYHESPHNVLLDEVVALGIIGALPFLILCGWAGASAWRMLRDWETSFLGSAMLAGIISLQFNAFVLTTAFFFLLTAILVLAYRSVQIQPAQSTMRWSAMPAFGLTAALLTAAGYFSAGDILLGRVRTLIEANKVVEASRAYELLQRWELRRGSSDLYYSRNMGVLARKQPDLFRSLKAWQEGVQSGLRAVKTAEDRHNAYYHLASLYAQINNQRDTEKSLRGAVGVAPNWFKPHWLLAQVLRAGGRSAEALAEAELAVERDGGKHAEVSETLRVLQAK
jgi:O-antigen ligase